MRISRCIATAVLMLLAGHVGRASASTSYNVIDLGSLGGSYSFPTAINDSGEIAGDAYITGNSAYHAALWTNSSTAAIDLGTLGGTDSQANGINASGQVVGLAFTTGSVQHAALWTNANGVAIDLGTLGGTVSQAYGINASGQIVGSANITNDAAGHAALWTNTNSGAIDLGTLGGTASQAKGINDSGQIVGFANTTGDSTTHAALWTNSSSPAIDIGTLGGSRSQAMGINDSGQIVGSAYITGDTASHAALWTNGSSPAVDLGTLGGTSSQANSINSAGQMVGWADLSNNTSHAALWTSGASPAIDLNMLIPTNSGWILSYPYAINDSGEIVGYGMVGGSNYHAFVLIPIPSTAPVANFSAAPTNGVAPLGVTFTDTSTGGTNWSWTFGDGGTTNLATNSVFYTYNTAGVYSVTDIVSGPGGSGTDTVANYITVLTPPPSASFTAGPTNGVAPLGVTFTDTSTGGTNWSWTFGDGGTTNLATNSVFYTYSTAGVYSVTDIVSGPGGSGTDTVANYITVLTPPPVASFTAGPTNGAAPLNVGFTDQSSGSVTGWAWTFGDGNTSTNQNPSDIYVNPGTYTVQEIVTGNGGSGTNTQTALINVYDPFAWWQLQYFGTNSSASTAAGGDYTGSGMSNTNKFMAGFNPTNAAAYLHVISIMEQSVAGSNNVVVTYLGASGDNTYLPGIASRTNVLDYMTGDANGNYTNGGWQDTGQTNILSGGNGSGTVTNMTDTAIPGTPTNRYYRVRVVLP